MTTDTRTPATATDAAAHALCEALTDDGWAGCYDGQTDALYALESSGAVIVWSRYGSTLEARASRTARELADHEPDAADALEQLADALAPITEYVAEAVDHLDAGDTETATAARDAARAWLAAAGLPAWLDRGHGAAWFRLAL